ncbi:type II secretion system protein GspM [Kangiella sp. HZ709]|uniref:type II secretion system protein GspM n=1 Tax=Kangiella sp. HZ709 TaxID=2666328 RepID=UPI0012B04E59|nr:type II secretion system protein GspM [Kangiella sp. HZ709]MRX28225.1 type II secretion system protein M [Kangiella sp. HZ709]
MSELKNWYAGLNQREKLMIQILAISFGLLLITLLIILPIKDYRAGLVNDRDALASQLGALKQQVATLKAGGVNATSSQPLNQMVNQTANQYGLRLSNIQERKRNQEMQLRLDDVEFDKLIQWVSDLEQNKGLIVENFRVSKTDASGKVDVSLKVLRAG